MLLDVIVVKPERVSPGSESRSALSTLFE